MGQHKNAILHDFPDHFATERLLIRAPRPGDGPALNAAILESRDSLRQWLFWAEDEPTVEETEANVREAALRFLAREDLRLFLFRKEDGLLVGSSGLHSVNWHVPSFEIGYWVRSSMQGQGYITEAVNGITDFAFTHLHAERIEIQVDLANTRSIAVAERAGYSLEAHLRRHHRDVAGAVVDTLVYVMLAA